MRAWRASASSIVAASAQRHSAGKPRAPRAGPARRARLRRPSAAWRATAATTLGQRRRAGGPRRWSRPARSLARSATGRSPARRAGPRSPPSRIRAAIARASSSVAGGASSTLKATSGGRAATSTAPAVGCSCAGPEVRAQLAGLDPPRQLPGTAAAQLGAGTTRRPGPRTGTPAAPARCTEQVARAPGPRRTRAPRSAGCR